MTVCLTGDVHHMSLETRDQEYMDRTEVEAAIEYAEVAAEYDVPVTLFVTGKAAEEEPERVKRLAVMENVEIGGHNYWAFDTLIHTKGWRGVTGSWNGPRPFQRWEIRKTIETFEELGIEITSWRDHASTRQAHGGVAVGGGYHAFFRRGGTGRRGSRGGRIDCGSDKHAARSRARVSRVSDAGIRGRE